MFAVPKLNVTLFIQYQPGDDQFPLDSDGKIIGDDTHFVDTWEVSESLMKC